MGVADTKREVGLLGHKVREKGEPGAELGGEGKREARVSLKEGFLPPPSPSSISS